MQNNLNAPAPGADRCFLASKPTPELAQQYGMITAELLDMGSFRMWRESLLNVLDGYLRACFEGDHIGDYSSPCDVVELVRFFDRIEEVGQEAVNAKPVKP